jgi:hypothetical protein
MRHAALASQQHCCNPGCCMVLTHLNTKSLRSEEAWLHNHLLYKEQNLMITTP